MNRLEEKLRVMKVPLLLLCAALLCCGCQSVSFYQQAVGGELEILTHRQSIEKLAADPKTPPDMQHRFRLILQLRQFAETDLKLRPGGYYRQYVDLKREYVVWDVRATPELSLKPKTWWYPIVGRLKYRGYFSERDARWYADQLQSRGYDVCVDGIEAYSTLGWFSDPILNTFIHHSEPDLAETIFHELAHQRLFIPGDTDFNEAFATTVGEEGVHRWLRATGNEALIQSYEKEAQRDAQFVELVLATREKLGALYADLHASEESKRQQKAATIDGMRAEYQKLKTSWGGYDGYDHWFSQPLNNAHLNAVATYELLVPAFRQLLAGVNGDLENFFHEVELLGKLPKQERQKRLQELLAKSKAAH